MTDTATAFEVLSRRYAEQGDLRMAQLSAWTADLRVLEQLLWENGLDRAPDPAGQLAAVGESVAESIEACARELAAGRSTTGRAIVETAREALVTAFDESVHELVADRFSDLDHLDLLVVDDELPHPRQRVEARLAGRAPLELASELHAAAADCAAVSDALAGEGHDRAAVRLDLQADAAAYESYLISAAVDAGDELLASVELRWAVVEDSAAAAGSDADARREEMAAAVGAAELEELACYLARPAR